MPATPTYIVISFSPNQRQQLQAAPAQQFKIPERAISQAERAIGRAVGSVVLEQLPDEFAEPRLVKAFGRLPDGFTDNLAA